MVAPMPWAASSVRLSALMVTCAHRGRRAVAGGRANCGALPRQVVVVQHRRASGAGPQRPPPPRRVQGERAEVLDDDHVGVRQRRSTSAGVGGSGGADGQPG